MDGIESRIAEWREYVSASPTLDDRAIDELEDHLRDQISDLVAAGLSDEEALLIAVKRMGRLDELTREFANENSARLWRQLVIAEEGGRSETDHGWVEPVAIALLAAAVIQVARLVAGFPTDEPTWLIRNAALFVLPFLAIYFGRSRALTRRGWLATAAPFVVAAVAINVYPFGEASSTELLVAAHLPVLLWFVIAYPYMGGYTKSHEKRMDFVRFTGEWLIYYVLIALGGGVLLGLTALVLEPTGIIDPERVIEWVLPSGAAGAVVIAAWLVESKQRVVENMAPVLTMIFTPLFALMLVTSAVVYVASGFGDGFDRELLGVFDLLMVVVLGLVIYGVSAREPSESPSWMDRIQFLAVASALVLDLIVLGEMLARIGDLGFTPNRTAALGLNLVLLVSLGGTAWLSARFVTGRGGFHRVERWQTAYLPVFALWAGAVVFALPPLFGFA